LQTKIDYRLDICIELHRLQGGESMKKLFPPAKCKTPSAAEAAILVLLTSGVSSTRWASTNQTRVSSSALHASQPTPSLLARHAFRPAPAQLSRPRVSCRCSSCLRTSPCFGVHLRTRTGTRSCGGIAGCRCVVRVSRPGQD
jgi:hypothetical protein